MLLQAGVLVVRVTQLLSILSFATNCPSVNVSNYVVAFLKFLEEKEIFNFFFSALGRHALLQASVCVSACETCQCVWLCRVGLFE